MSEKPQNLKLKTKAFQLIAIFTTIDKRSKREFWPLAFGIQPF